MIFDYIALAFLLFFITFFFDVFYKYLRYREITPRKMFTFRKGGLFEHFIIVLIILGTIVTIQFITGLSPFEDNIFFQVINLLTFTAVVLVFLIFILVFIFYFIMIIYVKIKKIEDRQDFFSKQSHRIILYAFVIATTVVGILFIQGIMALIN